MADFNSLPGSVVHTMCSAWGAMGNGSSSGAGGTGGSRGGSGGGAADARQAGSEQAGSGAAAANGVASVADADATDAGIAALAGAPQGVRGRSLWPSTCICRRFRTSQQQQMTTTMWWRPDRCARCQHMQRQCAAGKASCFYTQLQP